jgi:hypothetical protein
MGSAPEPELHLGDRLDEQFVDPPTQLLAAEARQLGEQGRRIDGERQLAVAKADHLAVRSLGRRQDLVERGVQVTPAPLPAGLLDDVPQEIACASRICHWNVPR